MIKRYLRVIIVLVVLVGIAVLAKDRVAWAEPAAETGQADVLGQVGYSISPDWRDPGSVKPPSATVNACINGLYSVGGVFTVDIKDLKPGYCIEIELSRPSHVGLIPKDAGKALAHMGIYRVYFQGKLVYELPAADGSIQTCYAVPPQKQAQIYFYDFFGQRFEKRTGPPSWEIMNTTVDKNIACAFTQKSGIYALIGK